MLYFFILIPIFSIVAALVLLNYNGRKQFLRFDFVQFIYSFIIVPMLFVWMKSFIYFLFRIEIGKSISFSEFLALDTTFSVVFLFVATFIVIHSLTKSFELQREKDPLIDIYELSEYFHQTFSHLAIYLIGFLLVTIMSLANLLLPFQPVITTRFYPGLALGLLTGIVTYMSVIAYENATRPYLRIMKLAYGLIFLIHVLAYFFVSPPFTSTYGVYWITLTASITLIFLAVFAKDPEHPLLLWLPFVIHPKKGVTIVKNITNLITEKR